MRIRLALPTAVVGAFSAIALLLGIATSAQAQTKEKLVVVSWGGTWGDAMKETLFKPFEKETGITVELRPQGSMMDMLATLTAQKDRMEADVWVTGIAPTLLADKAGLLLPIPRDKVPNAAALPEGMTGDKYVALWNIFYGIAYNSKTVPFEITDWKDLLDPRLKQKVGVPHGSGYGGKFILLQSWLGGGDERNIEPAFANLEKLKPNIGVVTKSDPDAIKMLTTGEIDVATMMPVGNYLQIKERGDHYRFVAPTPYVPVNFNNFVLLKGPNPSAGIRFINFALSPAAQTALAEKVLVLPANPQATTPAALKPYTPANMKMRVGDEAAIAGQLPTWSNRWNAALQK